MGDSIREQILTSWGERLAIIEQDNGFNTDMGKIVLRSFLPELDFEDVPVIGFAPGPEENVFERANEYSMQIVCQGVSKFGEIPSYEMSELVYADIMESVLGVEYLLDFDGGGTYQPAVGQTVEGNSSGATGYIGAISIDSGSWAGGDADGSFLLRRVMGEPFQDNEALNIGVESDVATVDGELTGQKAEYTTTGNKAQSIIYVMSEIQMPNAEQETIGVKITYLVNYRAISGNPYFLTS
jgi:hypothetical protein